MHILEVQNLCKQFDNAQVLKGIDFTQDEGQVVSVIGSSGSGKTTFLRDMSRLLSSGFGGKYRKVAVVDERSEISSGFDVGINTDIIKLNIIC